MASGVSLRGGVRAGLRLFASQTHTLPRMAVHVHPQRCNTSQDRTLSTAATLHDATRVFEQIGKRVSDGMFLPSKERREIENKLDVSTHELMGSLIEHTKLSSFPGISEFQVGAVALGSSGNLHFGVNLEFPGSTIGSTVHAEQYMVSNAFRRGEPKLELLVVNAAPCGHCRQFLNELPAASELIVSFPVEATITDGDWVTKPLHDFLPYAFGPDALGVEERTLPPTSKKLFNENDASVTKAVEGNALLGQALTAAKMSYAPYSQTAGGVALRMADGSVHCGSYIENAAFNPSMLPLQCALIAMLSEGGEPGGIEEAVLVQGHLYSRYRARPEHFSLSPTNEGFSVVGATRDVLNAVTGGRVELQEFYMP